MLRTKLCFALSILVSLPALADQSTCEPTEKFAPGVISTSQWDWRLSFDPDRHQAFWATSVGWWPATREQAYIQTSTWNARTGWSTAEVASFSGVHSDFDPFVSNDGRTLYFSSMRPIDGVAKTDMDLWMVERTNDGWGEPVHLGAGPNRDGYDELYASVDSHGNLYFGRVKAPFPSEDVGIFRSARNADGTYAPAELVAGINTPQRWEFNPEISPDGNTIVFTRLDRPGDGQPDQGYGYGDLYVSRVRHGTFGEAINLGPCVNTWADEYHPTVLWGSQTLFFARDAGARGDFYQTKLKLPR